MPPTQAPAALITGASSGIGLATALHLHRRGWRVYGTSRAPAPGPFEWLPMDVADAAAVQRGVAEVLARAGTLDALVCCAGYGLAGPVEETPLEEARAQLETNFLGVVRVAQALLPHLRARGRGTLVVIGSIAGRVAVPFQAYYSAGKFALEGWAEALRMELRPFGVRVVLVEPGDYRTAFPDRRRRVGAGPASPYRDACARALGAMEAAERTGPDPAAVAALVERILTSRDPRLRYTTGRPLDRLAPLLKGWLPGRWLEGLVRGHYGL